jgi:hypothetical protein
MSPTSDAGCATCAMSSAACEGRKPTPPTLTELRAENDELRLYLTALMRLLATKGVVTREELEQVETQRGLPPSRVGLRPSRYGGRR